MEDQNLAVLAQLIRCYPVKEVMKALEKVIIAQADELSDLNLGHSGLAKELSLAAWHLHLFTTSKFW